MWGGGGSSLTRTLFFTDTLTSGGSHFHLGSILSFVTQLEIRSYIAKFFLLFSWLKLCWVKSNTAECGDLILYRETKVLCNCWLRFPTVTCTNRDHMCSRHIDTCRCAQHPASAVQPPASRLHSGQKGLSPCALRLGRLQPEALPSLLPSPQGCRGLLLRPGSCCPSFPLSLAFQLF